MSTSSSFVPKLIANKQNVTDKLVVPSSKIPKPHKKDNVQPEPIKLEEERLKHEKKDKTIEQLTKMVPVDLNTSAAAKNDFFDSNGRPSIICRRDVNEMESFANISQQSFRQQFGCFAVIGIEKQFYHGYQLGEQDEKVTPFDFSDISDTEFQHFFGIG
uniref:Uncharacterized protein n=1 Tax=Panagrolaimus sp. JU765 TaxID=591449 RepID=A0AC34R8R4_9BILA